MELRPLALGLVPLGQARRAEGERDSRGVAGWAEYDFEIPADGWYELYSDCVWGWCRDIYVDGRLLFYLSYTTGTTC